MSDLTRYGEFDIVDLRIHCHDLLKRLRRRNRIFERASLMKLANNTFPRLKHRTGLEYALLALRLLILRMTMSLLNASIMINDC